MVRLIFFAAAIVLSLLALFRLRHGWIAEEAKRKVAGSGNIASGAEPHRADWASMFWRLA